MKGTKINVHYSITYTESQKQVEYPPAEDQKNKLLCPRKALHHEKDTIALQSLTWKGLHA